MGFKSDFFDRRLRINAAAFYNKFNDIILTLSACPSVPCIQPRNVGKANVKGAELEFSAYPTDGLSFDGSLSYIDFKYNKASVASAGLTGNEVTPYTPKWTWSLGMQYDYHTAADSTLGFRLDGAYQSHIFSETFNTKWSRIDGRFIGNARVYYKSPGDEWELSAEVKNVFNKYYFTSKEDVTTSLGEVLGTPGMPRTWLVTLRRNFGAPKAPPPLRLRLRLPTLRRRRRRLRSRLTSSASMARWLPWTQRARPRRLRLRPRWPPPASAAKAAALRCKRKAARAIAPPFRCG